MNDNSQEKHDGVNSRLLTFQQVVSAYDAITIGGLRSWRFSNTGNFNDCVVAVGRKLMVDVQRFEEWLDSHRDTP